MNKAFKIALLFGLSFAASNLSAQTIAIKPGEKWFGGAVNDAHLMPFADGYSLNLYGDTRGNQAAPLL
ncbi:MAG: glycoside hydrolase, partial [Cytophagaceae bacterium]